MAKISPRWAQEGPRPAQGGPRSAQDGPRSEEERFASTGAPFWYGKGCLGQTSSAGRRPARRNAQAPWEPLPNDAKGFTRPLYAQHGPPPQGGGRIDNACGASPATPSCWAVVCGPLSACWRHLGPSRGHLGVILGPAWRQLGPIFAHLGQIVTELGVILEIISDRWRSCRKIYKNP